MDILYTAWSNGLLAYKNTKVFAFWIITVMNVRCRVLRDHSGYRFKQWETMLHCNGVSYWLRPYSAYFAHTMPSVKADHIIMYIHMCAEFHWWFFCYMLLINDSRWHFGFLAISLPTTIQSFMVALLLNCLVQMSLDRGQDKAHCGTLRTSFKSMGEVCCYDNNLILRYWHFIFCLG